MPACWLARMAVDRLGTAAGPSCPVGPSKVRPLISSKVIFCAPGFSRRAKARTRRPCEAIASSAWRNASLPQAADWPEGVQRAAAAFEQHFGSAFDVYRAIGVQGGHVLVLRVEGDGIQPGGVGSCDQG